LYSTVIDKQQIQKGFLASAYSNLVNTPLSGLDTQENNRWEALIFNISGKKTIELIVIPKLILI